MKPATIDALQRALEAIAEQFRMIEAAKGEKRLEHNCSAIQDAQIALINELPDDDKKG